MIRVWPRSCTKSFTTSLLDTGWAHVTSEIEKSDGVRIGADLSIVSVGEAARSGERSVRVPLVLGDADGETIPPLEVVRRAV